MKATELRLGNYVYHESSTCKLETVLAFEDVEEYNPIPLTEEWLLKLNFIPHTTRSNPGEFTIYYKNEFTYNPCSGWWLFGKSLKGKVVLEHVHQLQNLFFALTGEELEIIT